MRSRLVIAEENGVAEAADEKEHSTTSLLVATLRSARPTSANLLYTALFDDEGAPPDCENGTKTPSQAGPQGSANRDCRSLWAQADRAERTQYTRLL
jgi:hypothetical protein